MTAPTSVTNPPSLDEPAPRKLGPLPLPRSIGPLMLLLVSAAGIFAVLWGALVANPGIEVRQFDAGDVRRFAIGEVVAFPDEHIFVVGLEDGRVRAVDGRIEATRCSAELLPDDPRGRALNPTGSTGVLADPCSDAVWSIAGDAIAGANEPLRTPQVSFATDTDGVQHVLIEIVSVGDD